MKFDTTKCYYCGNQMLSGLAVCPSCGKEQKGIGGSGSLQPRALLAFGLAVAVLFIFSWFKSSPLPTDPVNSPPSASLPSR
jgi:hypothetical protein